MVGEGPAGARADEARPPASSLPGQVHPAARRRALPPSRACEGARARSVRRLGDDARPGARERARLRRRRHRGVQLPAHAREDDRLQPVCAGARPARRARALRARRRQAGSSNRLCPRTGSRRRRSRISSASARLRPSTSTPMSCASFWRAPLARRAEPRTSTSTSRLRRRPRRTGASSTSASASRSIAPITSSAGTRSTR